MLLLQIPVVKQTMAEEAKRALWSGPNPGVLFHVPAAAICWGTYALRKHHAACFAANEFDFSEMLAQWLPFPALRQHPPDGTCQLLMLTMARMPSGCEVLSSDADEYRHLYM